MKKRNIVIVFILLLIGQLFMGYYTHYSAKTDSDFTINTFIDYITEKTNINHLIAMSIISLLIILAMHFILKI